MTYKTKILIGLISYLIIGVLISAFGYGQTKPVTYINAQKALAYVSQQQPLPCKFIVLDGTTYVVIVEGDIIKTLKPIPCKIY